MERFIRLLCPLTAIIFLTINSLTNSATAPNGGYELKVDDTTIGSRLLDVEIQIKFTYRQIQINCHYANKRTGYGIHK